MKKGVKTKEPKVPAQAKPNIADTMARIERLLMMLEQKIDVLTSRTAALHAQLRPQDQPHRPPEAKQPNNFRERTLHKAICADCNKECEVPFKPTGDRPVYCQPCFAKRRGIGGPFKGKHDVKPQAAAPVKPHPAEKRKPAQKKKPAGRKKK